MSLHDLQLYNLRPLTDSNTLLEAEKNQIWIPSVTFVNTARQVFACDRIADNDDDDDDDGDDDEIVKK